MMPKTILVADDNAAIRKALCERFEIEEDYDLCAEASNGMEAVELATRWRPDLVILDLSMPIMNGYDAALEIKRALPGHPDYFIYDVCGCGEDPGDGSRITYGPGSV